MANFYTYHADGTMTLSRICQSLGVSKTEVYNINKDEYAPEMTVGQYLQSLDLSGEEVPLGLIFKIPVGLTGGVNTRYSSGFNYSTLLTTVSGQDTKYNIFKENHQMMTPSDTSTDRSVYENSARRHQGYRTSAQRSSRSGSVVDYSRYVSTKWSPSNAMSSTDYDCFMYVLLDGGAVSKSWVLPVYPNEFADNNSASFSQVSTLGRSVDYQIYNGSSRDVSFTLNLHEDLCSDPNYIHNLVAYIESACYPGYSSGRVQTPEVVFNIGNQFKIRGILTNCGANWKAPIVDKRLVNCDLSIGVKETNGPYSMSQIRSRGGRR